MSSALRRSALVVAVAALALGLSGANGTAGEVPADPLSSPVWKDIVAAHFPGEVVIDDRVKVVVPSVVENQAQVPIVADARRIPNVEKLVVVADLNPIRHVLTLAPHAQKAHAYVSFRMKVEQATPVRAAALTSDGVWHVGSAFLESAGGGCSAPATARGETDWSDTVGNAQGRAWRQADGSARMRLRVKHPMDTGLAKDNTPAFYIEKLDVKTKGGDPLATLEMFEPVSEDPTVTIEVKLPPAEGEINVDGRDNNGSIYRSVVPVPWNDSAAPRSLQEPRG